MTRRSARSASIGRGASGNTSPASAGGASSGPREEFRPRIEGDAQRRLGRDPVDQDLRAVRSIGAHKCREKPGGRGLAGDGAEPAAVDADNDRQASGRATGSMPGRCPVRRPRSECRDPATPSRRQGRRLDLPWPAPSVRPKQSRGSSPLRAISAASRRTPRAPCRPWRPIAGRRATRGFAPAAPACCRLRRLSAAPSAATANRSRDGTSSWKAYAPPPARAGTASRNHRPRRRSAKSPSRAKIGW